MNHDLNTGIYSVEIRHDGLQKYRIIRGRDQHVVGQKALAQTKAWNAQWSRQRAKDELKQSREAKKRQDERSKEAEQRRLNSRNEEAQKRTKEAKTELEALKNLLIDALKRNPAPDFEKLRDRERFEPEEFSKPEPECPSYPAEAKFRAEPNRPSEPEIPERPSEDAPKYRPVFTLLDKIFPSRKERAIAAARGLRQADMAAWEQEKEEVEAQWLADLADWEKRKSEVEEQNAKRRSAFEARAAKGQITFGARHAAWKQEKDAFELKQSAAAKSFKERQKKFNDSLKHIGQTYSQKTPEGVVEYCRLVLSQSDYPENFPKTFELEYNPESRLLLVEYSFPAIGTLPILVEVSYQPTKDEFKEVVLSDSSLNKLYDDVLYRITLRSLHELFDADRARAVDSIVFNGWVHAINKATGKNVNTCLLSVHAKRDSFLDFDLKNVDPKACFKLLKGVGSSELHGLAAIAPIMRIVKTDKRFVEAYSVTGKLDNAVNLAAMGWEDFEHLVRELFEKEFAQYGGEVKITQASRDGGVDAVAFDPDPIRGGKIVIQAKRYTNVVGLSAVRDLYGTVVNEGAIKGILITTADYGPDAYEFMKDKPLTLLNGSNLLHMLERHGHAAKIDLREAKRILAQENRR